ncbi:TagK domain-containing protein [Variovorax sp. ZS18.2.2]|uniref:TagK domain-containing protein n=1 Tax=Variovorax sp. ZS18.2.2 TaxID=2971255 RepID=UPI0021507BB7|nr:TagK domain-containing protein [Variovorax sp. ZS18.2.2]MCR6475735.1 TagK domain-containing protein [Variovorax sp. ZS18.2.2]
MAPLILRLTHSSGEARHETMLIPPAGAGMADSLQLRAEHQSVGRGGVANLCRIAWRGEAEGWQLSNGSYTLMCARNGKRVRAGAVVPVAVGDTLELGLLRFVLEQGTQKAQQAQQAPERMPAAIETQAVQLAAPEDRDIGSASPQAFELRDLDGRGSDGGRRIDSLADPFGVLDIAGARSRPAADILAALLDERPRLEARTAPSAKPLFDAGPADVLLDELHEEFVRVVQDPGQLAGRNPWEGFVLLGAEAAPTLEELSRQAETYPLLRDILLPREGIDQIIGAFEPLARSGLLDAEPSQELLGMFAPELAREATVSLPSLTRREHHDLSPDSHVRIGSTRVGDRHGDNDREGVL